MTSLNPLHTIERQVGEMLWSTSGMGGADGAGAHARAADAGRHPRCREPARRLSAPAFRRPAPARHDRHGARQRAGPLHRRRADHRARRDRAGADPAAARASCRGRAGMAMLFITHDLGIVRQIADRVCVMTGGRDRRAGADRGVFASPQHPYTRASARRRAEGRAAADRGPTAPGGDGGRQSQGLVPDPARAFCARPSATSRRSTASTSPCARARRSASSANPAPARRRSASR